MLNVPGPDRFFENCLVECGLVDGKIQRVTLGQFSTEDKARAGLCRTLKSIMLGADKILAQGKPNDLENAKTLPFEEWERRWKGWAASRKAAFYSRAALFMLGQDFTQNFNYFLNILRNSHNILFIGAANDVIQHATGLYLNGPPEDFERKQLAGWWENNFISAQRIRQI